MELTVPVIGILRGVSAAFFPHLLEASLAAGLQAIEVTMNTVGAEKMIADNRHRMPAGRMLGMGTIRCLDEARRAVAAGAMFLVTPNLDLEVIAFAKEQGVPVVTGALTPTEVYAAWTAGAAMVKIFPCGALGGARYIRDLRGPFDQIPLVAVGGVNVENVQDFLVAGAKAVGVGASLFSVAALKEEDAGKAGVAIRRFITCCCPEKVHL